MNRKYKCDHCGQYSLPTKSSFSQHQTDVDSEKIFVTIFSCPHCQKDSIIQLDNEDTWRRSRVLVNMRARQIVLNNNDRNLHPKQKIKLVKIEREISIDRKKLFDKYHPIVDQLISGDGTLH